MTKLYLQNNYELQVAINKDEYTVTASLYDSVMDTTTTLSQWEGGKWTSNSPANLSKFFVIAKEYKRVKSVIHNAMEELREKPAELDSVNKSVKSNLNLFKRLAVLKYHRTVKFFVY
jgi:hypothetical protein